MSRVVDLRLAVETVSHDQASIVVVRTIASHPRLEHRTVARFEDNELVAALPSGTEMRYRLRNQNTVEFVWRGKSSDWMAGVTARSGPASMMETIRIPAGSSADGKPLTLESIVFRPPGPEPFPTLLFNHGSTGEGKNPAVFRETSVEPNVACWFTERGWMLVFPQRRGRGKTDQILIAGQSRGGAGTFHVLPVEPAQNGYSIISVAELWNDTMIQYLKQITR